MIDLPSFIFKKNNYSLFVHAHNCGWPPKRMTERAVELAIVNKWLNLNKKNVIEIGAVTPYYWPNRICRVVDPTDKHPLVTDKASFLDIDISDYTCLSISTFEHIGTDRYGLKNNPKLVSEAFSKLFKQCNKFLITVPTGYNKICDEFLLGSHHENVDITCLQRGVNNNNWIEIKDPKIIPYGTSVPVNKKHNWTRNWANGLLIISRNCFNHD